ncbi:hypothetical protein NCCP133_35910 [Cytobacillus sp. NCCP-133]|nr:hypothetical protein NCCP133_35910 [Cytobacillus sp. NCCP-133]
MGSPAARKGPIGSTNNQWDKAPLIEVSLYFERNETSRLESGVSP